MKSQMAPAWVCVLFLCAGAASAQQQPTVKVTLLLETVTMLTGQKLEYQGKTRTATLAEIPPGGARS